MHVASFGTLIRRGQEGQRGVLHLLFALRGHAGKGLPVGIVLSVVFQHGGGFMFDVIDVASLGMMLTAPLDTTASIRALIRNNVSRHPRFCDRLFSLLGDDLARGGRDRQQRQRFHILVGQRATGGGERAETETSNPQTFLRAKLHCVVHHPDPIVRLCFGSSQFVIAQAQEP